MVLTPSRSKGRPSRAEAGEIDEAVRQAALQVLLEQGEAATMNAVAVAAGLSRKSLYARYPNKTALFVDVIRALMKTVQGLEYDTRGTAEERLENYVIAAFTTITLPHSLAIQRLLSVDSAYLGELREEMMAATRKIFLEPLVALLEETDAAGEFAVERIAPTAQAIIRLIFGEALSSQEAGAARMTDEQQADYAAFVARFVTRGLTPR